MNRRRDEEKRNEPTITKHISLIWLPANSPIIYSCDLGGEMNKIVKVTGGFHPNGTKSLLISSAKQFKHEVQLGFDCLLYFILSFLALENILHIIIKMSTCYKWALHSGGRKLINKMGCEIDKYTRDRRLGEKQVSHV